VFVYHGDIAKSGAIATRSAGYCQRSLAASNYCHDGGDDCLFIATFTIGYRQYPTSSRAIAQLKLHNHTLLSVSFSGRFAEFRLPS
jgi:hypothetical protein